MSFRELRFRVFLTVGILGGLSLIAAVLLVVMSSQSKQQTALFQSLHSQVLNRRNAVVPPQTVSERVKEAREQIAHFYEDRFPDTQSAIFEQLGKVANENKVKLNQANYKTDESDMAGIQQVVIGAHLVGSYAQVMKFINSVERDKMFFVVDSVSLGDQTAGNVTLNIRLETYMRGGTS